MLLVLLLGVNAVNKFLNKNKIIYDEKTMIGALSKYISTPKENFQPMNANFGIMPELEIKIKDKKERYKALAVRSLELFENI